MPGRLITDNIIVAFETLHTIRRKTRGKNGFMVLKLDMSMAYDRVDWPFLQAIMIKLGFSASWVSRIMDCVSTATFSFLLNGKAVGKVIPYRAFSKGVRFHPIYFYCVLRDSQLY